MKVLHVISSIATRYGGPSEAVIGMVKHQKMQGVNAEIATTHFVNEKPRKCEEINIYSFKSYLGEYKYSPGLKRWLKENINRYDLVHIHSVFCYTTFLTVSEARRANMPYIIRPIGQLYSWSLNNRKSILKKIYLRLFGKKQLENAQSIHFATKDEKENIIISLKNKNMYVLPLGVDLPKKISKIEFNQMFPELKEKDIILFLSRIHLKKGLDLLLPSIEDILKDKNCILVIAGSGRKRYLEKLKNRIEEFDLANQVYFAGYVDGERKTALLQNSKAFILPSYSENFGIVVVEAMASGLPVLISDQVGISDDVIRENAGIVFPLRRDAIKEAVNKIIGNKDLGNKLGGNGELLAKKQYDWKEITKKQIDIYKNIIKINKKNRARLNHKTINKSPINFKFLVVL